MHRARLSPFLSRDDEIPTPERGGFWSLVSVENLKATSSCVVVNLAVVCCPARRACPRRSDDDGVLCCDHAWPARLTPTPQCTPLYIYIYVASEFLLEELKVLCEHSARKIVSVANVAKMLLAAEKYHAETLKASCLSYVQKNMAEVGCVMFVNYVWEGEGEGVRLASITLDGMWPMKRRSVAAGRRMVALYSASTYRVLHGRIPEGDQCDQCSPPLLLCGFFCVVLCFPCIKTEIPADQSG